MTRGLDLAALTGWLDTRHPGLRRGALRGELIEGGRSNLTFLVSDDASFVSGAELLVDGALTAKAY